MSLQRASNPATLSVRSVAREFGYVTAALAGVYLWRRLADAALSAAFGPPPRPGGLLVDGLVSGGVFVVGLASLAAVYAAARDVEFGLDLPAGPDLPAVGLAVLVPLALVGLTEAVGAATGVPYNSLTKTAVAADAPLPPILLVAGLSLLVGVPSLVVVCQVLVQGSFERAVGSDGAVALTTLATGFALVDTTGRLTAVPDTGKLAGLVAFALLFGLALSARSWTDREWLRYLASLPVLAFGALVVLSGVAAVSSVAGGLFATTQVAVLGVAAYARDRTGSLLPPALAYASLALANRAVVVVFEAEMQSW